ncbi:MAG: ABC transporter substrate-binding protein [Defluviitaleaceae bacterium]|nr:ABC transporter substrate-binding protein [Defluviitaleaceae bacterium]
MKKRFFAFALAAIMALSGVVFTGCRNNEEEDGLITVRLNQVVHSIFYAPQYVAMELGFFEDEGLLIELSTGQGADRTMTALISGEADIGLMGTEAALYVYIGGLLDHAVAFAQLTQRAGNFLLAREPMPNFTWADVAGSTIIGGRAGGMPQMVLEYILRQNDLDPQTDVEILTNLAFTTTAGAFTGGVGDFTAEFEPSAFALEQAGIGYVVAMMGADSGLLPYTAYFALGSFIEGNPAIIQSFTNAVQRGMEWVSTHTALEIAEVIHVHFPEHSLENLAFMVQRHIDMDAWNPNTVFVREGFYLLQDIMEQGGELLRRVPFESLINNDFAEEALRR